jgi:hypothetical protein
MLIKLLTFWTLSIILFLNKKQDDDVQKVNNFIQAVIGMNLDGALTFLTYLISGDAMIKINFLKANTSNHWPPRGK